MTEATEQGLWEFLGDCVEDSVLAWGRPQDLAAQGGFPRGEARLLRRWLASLEASVRALLTVMALRLIPTLPPRTGRAAPSRKASASARAQSAAGPEAPAAEAPAAPDAGADAETTSTEEAAGAAAETAEPAAAPPGSPGSETWAVFFRLVPGPRTPAAKKKKKRRRGAAGGTRSDLVRTLPLARRYEALIRVIAKPEPYARRLARLLAADRYLAARTAARPELAGDGPVYYADLLEDSLELAWAALRAPAPETG